MPKHVVFDKDFKQVGQDLSNRARKLKELVKQSGCENDRVKGCLEKAEMLEKIPDPTPKKIALVGDAGVGKSSLVNSLVGIPKLAKAVSA